MGTLVLSPGSLAGSGMGEGWVLRARILRHTAFGWGCEAMGGSRDVCDFDKLEEAVRSANHAVVLATSAAQRGALLAEESTAAAATKIYWGLVAELGIITEDGRSPSPSPASTGALNVAGTEAESLQMAFEKSNGTHAIMRVRDEIEREQGK